MACSILGVFLEAKSFGTGSLKVKIATVGVDGTLTEGCADGTLTFSLPTPIGQDYPIDYHVWGNAISGVDYQAIPSGLVIPAGQTEVSVPLIAYADNQLEAGDTIAIDVKRDPCHRDTIYVQIRDNSILPPSLRPDTTVCQSHLVPLTVNGTLPITLPPPPTFSNAQDFAIAPVNSFISLPGECVWPDSEKTGAGGDSFRLYEHRPPFRRRPGYLSLFAGGPVHGTFHG